MDLKRKITQYTSLARIAFWFSLVPVFTLGVSIFIPWYYYLTNRTIKCSVAEGYWMCPAASFVFYWRDWIVFISSVISISVLMVATLIYYQTKKWQRDGAIRAAGAAMRTYVITALLFSLAIMLFELAYFLY